MIPVLVHCCLALRTIPMCFGSDDGCDNDTPTNMLSMRVQASRHLSQAIVVLSESESMLVVAEPHGLAGFVVV